MPLPSIISVFQTKTEPTQPLEKNRKVSTVVWMCDEVCNASLGRRTSLTEVWISSIPSWQLDAFLARNPFILHTDVWSERGALQEWHITASDSSLCQLEQTEAHYGAPFSMAHQGLHGRQTGGGDREEKGIHNRGNFSFFFFFSSKKRCRQEEFLVDLRQWVEGGAEGS